MYQSSHQHPYCTYTFEINIQKDIPLLLVQTEKTIEEARADF
jgi:hypothetical protein